MKLKKINRERRQVIYFTDSRGIHRQAVIFRDNLSNSKKPPAWMQEIMISNDFENSKICKGA